MSRSGNMNPNSLKNLKPPFSKENQPENRGRKPSKVRQFLNDYELNYNDVTMLSKSVLQMTQKEVQMNAIDDDAPMIVRLFCRYLLEDMKNGHAKNINLLLDRSIGQTKQKVETSGGQELKIVREITKTEE